MPAGTVTGTTTLLALFAGGTATGPAVTEPVVTVPCSEALDRQRQPGTPSVTGYDAEPAAKTKCEIRCETKSRRQMCKVRARGASLAFKINRHGR